MKYLTLILLGICAMANVQQNVANGSVLLGFMVTIAFLAITTSIAHEDVL